MLSNVKIIVVGRIKEVYYRNKAEEFLRAIRKRYSAEVIELNDESIPGNAGESVMNGIRELEGKRILENIRNTDYVIALCIDGQMLFSDRLKAVAARDVERGFKDIVFVIGGSLGLSDAVVKRADYKLSFSHMTFPHQLMRVMLLEQLSVYL